ncbi:MAG: TIGR04255 family protein [Methanotrichaceae archaeon]
MGKKYKTNNLKDVIFRIDFTREIGQSRKLADAFYNQDIASLFPTRNDLKGKIIESSITAEPDGAKISQSHRDIMTFEFSDKDKTRTIHLEPSDIVIRITNNTYKDSDELKKISRCVISQLKNTYGNLISKRIGLRYINIISISDENAFEWGNYISANLLSMLQFVENKSELTRAMNVIHLNKENCKINFQSGMFNSEYPNPIARKEFVLDYDGFTTEEIELNGIEDAVVDIHKEIKKLFEGSITQGLRDKMGEIQNA